MQSDGHTLSISVIKADVLARRLGKATEVDMIVQSLGGQINRLTVVGKPVLE